MLVQAPDGALVEATTGKTHEVALDVELDDIGVALEVAGDFAHVMVKATDAKISTFIIAAAVRIVDKATVPPATDVIEDEVVDDAVTEGGGENLANNGLLGDKGDTAARMITLGEDVAAELVDILYEMGFEFELVTGF